MFTILQGINNDNLSIYSMPNHLGNTRFRKVIITPQNKTVDYLKYLPIVAPLLIFFGVARLSFYYGFFNVDIIYFLDFSEIITQFFDVLIVNAITIGLASTLFVITAFLVEISRKWLRAVVLLLVLAGTLVMVLTRKNWGNTNYIFLSVLFLTLLLFAFQQTFDPKSKIDPTLKAPLILCAVALILLTIRLSASADADDVMAFRKYEGVKVYYKDSLVTSTDKRYIGNTTNYVFVHDITKNVTEVYNLTDIKKIDFSEWSGRDFSDSVVKRNLQTTKPK